MTWQSEILKQFAINSDQILYTSIWCCLVENVCCVTNTIKLNLCHLLLQAVD